MFGDVIYRPVDRRQNFVKRCVALPGQRLKIVNDTIYIDGEMREFPKNVQFNYLYSTSSPLTDADLKELGIAQGDLSEIEAGSPSVSKSTPVLTCHTRQRTCVYISPHRRYD